MRGYRCLSWPARKGQAKRGTFILQALYTACLKSTSIIIVLFIVKGLSFRCGSVNRVQTKAELQDDNREVLDVPGLDQCQRFEIFSPRTKSVRDNGLGLVRA